MSHLLQLEAPVGASGGAPWCLIQPQVAASYPQNAHCWRADRLLWWRCRVLWDLLVTPSAVSAIKLKGRGYSCHSQRACKSSKHLVPLQGPASLAGKNSGEFICLFLFYCLHKTAWKLKELIISLSILFFSFSTWLDLALIAHLFIGFKWCTAENYCPSR